MTLSSKKIAAMKPRDKRYSVADGNGLTLRVMPSGRKIWYLRTSCSGRVADKRLGEHPDMSLMQARQKARRLRKDIGLEPPKGYVLKDAFRLWCRLKKPQIVSYQDERRRLERYIIEPIGNRQLDEITAPLVIRTVQPIEKDGKQATLKRVLMRLRLRGPRDWKAHQRSGACEAPARNISQGSSRCSWAAIDRSIVVG